MLSKTNRLTLWILVAMAIGIAVGWAMHNGMEESTRKSVADNLKILTDIFLRLVKMIIAPLVFSTLVVGIAKLGDMKTVGRVGGRALLWFISASLISLLLGMALVNLLKPGVGLHLEAAGDVSDVVEKTGVFTLRDFIAHLFPSSMVEAMARNEVLQIVVFSVFFGVACASIGDYATPVVKLLESTAHIILKMVGYVMNFAPLGVFGAIAAVIAVHGLAILGTYAVYIGQFYLGLAILWLLLLGVGFLFLGQRMKELLRRIVQPITIAFSTTSSEAVMPKLMEELERFGCKDKVVSFVLPLGYSFNLDGSMMYMTFASLFIAQVYGIDMPIGAQITMLLTLMLTSKGIAGVPRASLVVVAATLGMFGIPVEGIALILPIDHFCDMGRSATNVVGNAIATSVVSKWEGELGH